MPPILYFTFHTSSYISFHTQPNNNINYQLSFASFNSLDIFQKATPFRKFEICIFTNSIYFLTTLICIFSSYNTLFIYTQTSIRFPYTNLNQTLKTIPTHNPSTTKSKPPYISNHILYPPTYPQITRYQPALLPTFQQPRPNPNSTQTLYSNLYHSPKETITSQTAQKETPFPSLI